MWFKSWFGEKMSSLPRKNSEFLAMYRKDIEEIIKPYGFEYEDRDEYYGSEFLPAEKWRGENFLYYKHMPYGKIYILIGSSGRLSEFNIHANFRPAIQEVANIEKIVYGDIGKKDSYNLLQWEQGGEGIKFDLLTSTHIMRDKEQYCSTLTDIRNNLSKYLDLKTISQLFETYLHRPNFYQFDFCFPQGYRLGYWLIMAKLAGENYYSELAEKYVEVNEEKIRKEYNVNITKLKDFLDTYTVGSLA